MTVSQEGELLLHLPAMGLEGEARKAVPSVEALSEDARVGERGQ